MFAKLWTLLHWFMAFSFVGSLRWAEWPGRSARATTDRSQRLLSVLYVALIVVMVHGPRS